MNPEHFPPSERERFQPAGRVHRSDGSVDKAGTWVRGGIFQRKDSGGQEIEYIRLLMPGDYTDGRMPTKEVPRALYEQWQQEADETPETGLERFTAREQRVFAPLDAEGQTGREHMTDDSAEEALSVMHDTLQRDASVKRLLDAEFENIDSEEAMLTALRGNSELRCELGRHFMDKLQTLPYLPERIKDNAANNLKNPNYPGYIKMTSHEYVAVLALSMLDGSFDTTREDGISRNEFGEVIAGQHRYAARELLRTYGD